MNWGWGAGAGAGAGAGSGAAMANANRQAKMNTLENMAIGMILADSTESTKLPRHAHPIL